MQEERRIAKEEADKKKAEEAAKKAEEKKKKDEEKRLEAEKKAEEERLAEEAKKKAKLLPDINCACFDVLLHPIEERMDNVLGKTVDPLGEEQTGHTRPNEHVNTLQLNLHVSLSSSRLSLYCLVVLGSAGIQLQCLVCHRPLGLPVPQ